MAWHVTAPRWIVAAAIGALAVALSSGAAPWVHAVGGAFRPPDLAQDLAAVRVAAAGGDPYGPLFPAEHARVLGLHASQGYPFFPHPPFVLVLTWPFAAASLASAAAVWFALSLALLFVLAALLAEAASGRRVGSADRRLPTGWIVGAFAALLLWPPVLYNLEKGQLSILLAVGLAAAWRALADGSTGRAGVFVGIAGAIKIVPLVVGGYIALRAPRAVLPLIACAVFATAIPLPWLGPSALVAFFIQASANLAHWETWPAVTYSLHGAAARLLVGGAWAEPWIHHPVLARLVTAAVGGALLAAAAAVTWSARRSGRRDGACYAAWCTLAVVLNPLSMGHNGVLLALPVVLTARALADRSASVPKAMWAVGLVLASVPRQTALGVAAEPVGPVEGLAVVALPMWGALLLLASALASARGDGTAVAPYPPGKQAGAGAGRASIGGRSARAATNERSVSTSIR